MKLLKRIDKFIMDKFHFSHHEATKKDEIYIEDKEELERIYEEFKENDKITISSSTIITKLYSLEQTITVLESSYPNEYNDFMKRIETLRLGYKTSINESEKKLTFEIDPDLDLKKIMEVIRLENEIKEFIENNIKYDNIIKRLQCLIFKLNVLYNASIYYEEEKEKVMNQLEHALNTEEEIINEFKESKYILESKQKKERIVWLTYYTDYIVYKINIRNSDKSYDELISDILIIREFEGRDYTLEFKNFILDEISDLKELLPLYENQSYTILLQKEIDNLLNTIISLDDMNEIIFGDISKEFLNLENKVISMLISNGVSKDKAKIKLLDRMDISVNENEIFVLPKTNTIICLSEILSNFDEEYYIFIRLLNFLTNDITYKEIYFLLILFNILNKVVDTKNNLLKYIEKYINRFQYSESDINVKKNNVFDMKNKKYIYIFDLDKSEETIIKKGLKNCNLDYVLRDSKLYMNSFYFNNLKNVMKSLEENSKKFLNGGIIYE